MSARILVVDDVETNVRLLEAKLTIEYYDVLTCGDGLTAIALATSEQPDLILLDVMMPGMDGWEVTRQLRRSTNLPIIILSAKGETSDRVFGLDLGADDYLTKPFEPSELLARVRAVLRRLRPALSGRALEFAGIAMDTAAHKVTREGQPLQLGPTEFRLLRHFLENPGRVFSREQLLDAVWGRDVYVEQRTVDVHIRRLRKAVNVADLPDVIRTVRSAGYALDVDTPPPAMSRAA